MPEEQGLLVLDGHPVEETWYANILRVARYGADFNTIQAAINYAATQTPSATNPWTIYFYPGIYNEAITCYAWVNLVGMNRDACIISQTDAIPVTLASNVELKNLIARIITPTVARQCIRDPVGAVTGVRLVNIKAEITTPGALAGRGFFFRSGSTATLESCEASFGGTGPSSILSASDAANTITLINCRFTNNSTDAWAFVVESWAGSLVSLLNSELDGTTRHMRAGTLGIIRLKNCQYRSLLRSGTGSIVDESPQLRGAPWHVVKWDWITALASMDVAVRGTPIDAGSGQILLEVNTGGAADQEAVETNPEAAGSLGNEFTPARTPRIIKQIAVDNFHADADMFFGLRETLGNAVPVATEHHAGFVWNGANFQASSDDGVATETTNLTTPTVDTHVQLEVIIFGGVSVEFYINGTLVATHTARVPSAALDWQHLLNNGAGGGAAADIDVTVRPGGCQECPA